MRTLCKKLPTAGGVALLIGAAITAASLIATARHDLARDASSIRGNSEVWDKATRLPGGAIAYLVAGRRPAPKSA